MKSTIAVSALLALAGTSHGFVVYQFAIQPFEAITPSSGGFVNSSSGFWHTPAGLVTGSAGYWNSYGNIIRNTTWLAGDRYGGGGVYYGMTADPPGPPGPVNAPEWRQDTGNILGGPGLGTADPAPNIDGGDSGVTWGAGDAANFQAPSAVSPVNGVDVDSIFFGQFVLTDQNATLTGGDLVMTLLEGNVFLPLDGSEGYFISSTRGTIPAGYSIEYERDGNLLRGFVVVPTPGAIGLAGLTGLAALRRRRR